MNIREITINKLQQLPEPLLEEVSDFIDFIANKHQSEIANEIPQNNVAEVWKRWFETADLLEVTPPEPTSTYQQFLLNKYRQQGLEL